MAVSSGVLPTRFRYRLSPVNTRRGLWVVAASLVPLLILVTLAADASLAETIIEDLRAQPPWAVALVVIGIVLLALMMVRIASMARDAWLVTDSEGIRCSPHRHHGPGWLRHDWQLSWSGIDKAIVQRPGPRSHRLQSWFFTTLTLESEGQRYDLALLNWEPVDEPLERPDIMALRPGKRLHRLTETHPLIRHLEQRDIPVEYRPLGFRSRWGLNRPKADQSDTEGEVPVDLLSFPSLAIMLALTCVLGVAVALHFTVLPPIRALWSPNYGVLVFVGCTVFALAVLLSRAAPARERTVVALLLGITVALLAHPLTARFLAVTGEDPVRVEYLIDAPGRFQPIDARHPDLDLSDLDIPEYWNSLSGDAVHPFELQAVGEGRYILRLDHLFERTRSFYSNMAAD